MVQDNADKPNLIYSNYETETFIFSYKQKHYRIRVRTSHPFTFSAAIKNNPKDTDEPWKIVDTRDFKLEKTNAFQFLYDRYGKKAFEPAEVVPIVQTHMGAHDE